MNNKKLPVSITYLSDGADNTMKARYATTTYLEVMRQISRLGIKASVQVPLNQIGYNVSEEIAVKNATELIELSKKCGVFVWLEMPENETVNSHLLNGSRNVGYALDSATGTEYLRARVDYARAVKILCNQEEEDGTKESKQLFKEVDAAVKRSLQMVLVSAPETLTRKLLTKGRRNNLVFEFQLGYNNKWISTLQKRGAKVSISVPFGKDWADYAISRVPEKYARFIAARFLKDEAVS